MSEMPYQINPDRNVPWNNLPLLPIRRELFQTIEILKKLGDAKAALARLHGRSVVIPDQGLLINTISLQEAKISSAVENIFTTDDELYKAYSDQSTKINEASKEVLRYREALWSGYLYAAERPGCDKRKVGQPGTLLKR
jgi:Fic family protein